MKIFYNLNYQDLHPHFEDNLNNWMTLLSSIIRINVFCFYFLVEMPQAFLEAILEIPITLKIFICLIFLLF